MIWKCFALRSLWTKLGEGSDLAAVRRPSTSLRNVRDDGAHHVLEKLMQMAAHYEMSGVHGRAESRWRKQTIQHQRRRRANSA